MNKKTIMPLLVILAIGCHAKDECRERVCIHDENESNGDNEDGIGNEGVSDEGECRSGSLGCLCDSDLCTIGLVCVDGICIEPLCIENDYPCYDNQDGSVGFCCGEYECIGYEDENFWTCSAPCSLHSECSTGCCIVIDGLDGLYCSLESVGCKKCIDSCYWSKDGSCDDGGPGSDFSICELGTDCSDCGVR